MRLDFVPYWEVLEPAIPVLKLHTKLGLVGAYCYFDLSLK